MIKVDNLSKRFGNQVALDNISFEIKEGEIFGFLGPSGAGKTTTINILTGQLSQDSGKAYILNKESNQLLPSDFLNIGIMSDTVGFYGACQRGRSAQGSGSFPETACWSVSI